MSIVWKVVLALALVLPVGAFVAGSLASSSADEPSRRGPVILEQVPQEKSPKPRPVERKPPEQQDDDAPVVIAPAPASNDDWDDDDRGDDDDRDDEDDEDDDGDDDGDDGDD